MSAPSFISVASEFTGLWRGMVTRQSKLDEVNAIARRLIAAKPRYLAVQQKTGVPWFVIAVIHEREASQNFNTQLGQGDPLGKVSTNVPAGMGPYFGVNAWERAAIEALQRDRLDKVADWSVERCCFELEVYNGEGYRSHGIHSPYLWSFSNQYAAGKYVADGVWSATAVDQQCGCMPIIKAMMAIDASISFGALVAAPPPPVIPPVSAGKHVAAGAAGAGAAAAAHQAGMPIWAVFLVFAAFAAATWAIIHYSQK